MGIVIFKSKDINFIFKDLKLYIHSKLFIVFCKNCVFYIFNYIQNRMAPKREYNPVRNYHIHNTPIWTDWHGKECTSITVQTISILYLSPEANVLCCACLKNS